MLIDFYGNYYALEDENKTWVYTNGTLVPRDIGTLNDTGINITLRADADWTQGDHFTVIR